MRLVQWLSILVANNYGLIMRRIWMEVTAENGEQAKEYLETNGCIYRHEIEALPENFSGFWISNPAKIIHLVNVVG